MAGGFLVSLERPPGKRGGPGVEGRAGRLQALACRGPPHPKACGLGGMRGRHPPPPTAGRRQDGSFQIRNNTAAGVPMAVEMRARRGSARGRRAFALPPPPPSAGRGALRPSPAPRPPPGGNSAMTSPRRPAASPPPARDPGAEIDRCRSQGQCLPGVAVTAWSLRPRPLCPLYSPTHTPPFNFPPPLSSQLAPRLLALGRRGGGDSACCLRRGGSGSRRAAARGPRACVSKVRARGVPAFAPHGPARAHTHTVQQTPT